ncbi:MAG TPA: iron uptake transporter deferrochelatase/peroxidase subunit [Marmoricola sp.]|nr:iron uptake transporter deferrochelatase/peroxidase subunit [Marmoricola sp.]
MSVNRRNFIKGTAAGAAGTAIAGGVVIGGAEADNNKSSNDSGASDRYPFDGTHQSGILTPGEKQSALTMAAFTVTASSKGELGNLLQTITERARFLTAGGTPPNLGVNRPPSDSDVLGPDIPSDGLTITVGFGASLFDKRFGLASKKPIHLTQMRVFPDDAIEEAWRDGDLSLQICANHQDTAHHALRDIMKHTRGNMQLLWKMEGYNSPPRPSGTGRNLLGFKDGTANPSGQTAESLIWVDDSKEPAWTQGGTYQVVRLIRMFVEFWDRVSIAEQENMFGRRRDSGAPLDGNQEFDTPDFTADPKGDVIPMDSHIRLANPRTKATANQRLLRRSYNYDLGVDMNGNMQSGHVFICYQQDVKRQFETVQERLVGEPLIDYVQPFGGGYFFVPPAPMNASDWFGKALFA